MFKLIKASDQASEKGVEHLMIVKEPYGGGFKLNGTGNLVGSILDHTDILNQLKTILSDVSGPIVPATLVTYPLLPCSPYSTEWNTNCSSRVIRTVLQRMISSAGYGKYGKRLGAGEPPPGWPQDTIAWNTFKGVGNSKLTNIHMTTIIVGMLEAAGIDPDTHVEESMDVESNEIHTVEDPS